MSWIKSALLGNTAFNTFAAVSTIGGGVYTLGHGLFPEFYQVMYARPVRDKPSVKNSEADRLLPSVFDDMKLEETERQRISVFNAVHGEFRTLGLLKKFLSMKCHIGLPDYFSYQELIDIPTDSYKIDGDPLNWENPGTPKLIDSLLLSDESKKFCLAKSIVEMQSNVLFAKSFVTVGILSGFFYVSSKIRDFVLGPKFMVQRAMFFYGVMAATFGVVHVVINDAVYCICERRIDAKTAAISEEYARGGLEFYQKLILRNQAARDLCKEAEQTYSVGGNEKFMLRTPYPPLTERVERLKQTVASFKSS